ncbi:hypothetical protein KM043_009171 [Ampulex compressa]|nr:hypothetical protein KM043_009171 [Ampulex compressa]
MERVGFGRIDDSSTDGWRMKSHRQNHRGFLEGFSSGTLRDLDQNEGQSMGQNLEMLDVSDNGLLSEQSHSLFVPDYPQTSTKREEIDVEIVDQNSSKNQAQDSSPNLPSQNLTLNIPQMSPQTIQNLTDNENQASREYTRLSTSHTRAEGTSLRVYPKPTDLPQTSTNPPHPIPPKSNPSPTSSRPSTLLPTSTIHDPPSARSRRRRGGTGPSRRRFEHPGTPQERAAARKSLSEHPSIRSVAREEEPRPSRRIDPAFHDTCGPATPRFRARAGPGGCW